jgi:tetratricopeptide (TPR) repeat protein
LTRRAILHIGTEKTGTTTLQFSLSAAADTLAASGFHYPVLGAGHAHVALVTYAKSTADVADLPALGGQSADETHAAFSARIEDEVAAAVAAHPDATFILSSEHASSRLIEDACVRRLKALLDRHFTTIDVMIYLRRWDRMAISAYATFVRNGMRAPFSFERMYGSDYLDYAGMLRRWSEVFGIARMHVGIYDRAALRGGSIVADFTTRFGLPAIASIGEINASPGPDTVATLMLLNRILVDADPQIATSIREAVVEAASSHRGGSAVLRREAEAFVALHADQAETIRAQYFPARTALFDDRYDDYDERPPDRAHNWRDVSEALVVAVVQIANDRLRVAAEADCLRAQLHLEANQLAEARSHIIRAIGVQPDNGHYHHILALIDARRGDRNEALASARRAAILDPTNDAYRASIAALD